MSSIRTPAAAQLRLPERTAQSRVRPPRARIHARRRRNAEGGSFAFALRLVLSFAAALIVVGVVGYWFMDIQLRGSQISRYAAIQKANAQTFEYYGRYAQTPAQATTQISRVVDAVSRQPGVLEAVLISPSGVIRASGKAFLVGSSGIDTHVAATLRSGKSYAGHESDPSLDQSNFEFVSPVSLPGGRYAFEMSYDRSVLRSQLSDVRRGLMLGGLLLLLWGSGMFYLFGGRSLLRSHRAALQRATRDGLTDLPNERAFRDEFALVLSAARRNHDPLALIALDVDDFAFVNDRYGGSHGDSMLKRVAAVLREGRPGDRAYRVGGDEFALLMPGTDAEGARALAKRLMRRLVEADVAATIGTSSWRPGYASDRLRAEADAALQEGKRLGGRQVAHFDDVSGDVTVIGIDKRAAVRSMIEDRRVTTVYQPIWNLAEDTVMGIEALSRPDPTCGVVGPAEAFDIAEQIDHVHELDAICIESALAGAACLPAGALLFLNLCPRTLDLDADGSDWLLAAVARAGIPADRIVIEITERFGGREPAILRSLQRLRSQGFRIAVDDVGTGNSGLAVLRQVDVEFVKLDRTICTAAAMDPASRAVLMAVATFARETGAFVIAEGIEDSETLEFLKSVDYDRFRGHGTIQGGQGYGLGLPVADIRCVADMPLRASSAAA
jgi:diguanylate cyclase (GGDEF)-like protein